MKRFLSIIAVICTFSILAGCGGSTVGNGDDSVAEIKIFRSDMGRIFTENNPVVEEIERRTNTKITMDLVRGSDVLSMYSISVAAGDIADISIIPGFDHFQFVQQGIYLELEDLIEEHGQNIKKVISNQKDWDLLKYNGKQYAIPYINTPGKFNLIARKDWMDNLNIETPQTLDEFVDMARKFTFGDPDKNGRNDTYGITTQNDTDYVNAFMHIFGAFGIQPNFYSIKDDVVIPDSISTEYKDAIELIARLYAEKVIDPEIFLHKQDQGRQKLVQGRSGSLSAWWSLVPQVLTEQLKMKDINPNAEWVILPAPIGSNGQSGLRSADTIQSSLAISKTSKNPVAAIRLLDFIATDEGWEITTYGLKGVHYTEIGKRTAEGDKGFNEKWLDVMSQVIMNVEKQNNDWKENTPENWKYIESAMGYNLYRNDLYGIVTNEYNSIYPEIQKIEEEWFIKFVTGDEPISKFGEYINQWKQKGGDRMVQSMVDEYNKRNGTNLRSGV